MTEPMPSACAVCVETAHGVCWSCMTVANPQTYDCAGCGTQVDGRSNLCLPCTNVAVQEQPAISGLYLAGYLLESFDQQGETVQAQDLLHRQGQMLGDDIRGSVENWKPGTKALLYAFLIGWFRSASIEAVREQARIDRGVA